MLGGEPLSIHQSYLPKHKLTIQNFGDFSFSKLSHFSQFEPVSMYASQTPRSCDLKVYQDLFMYTFILNNIKPGSRLLEIGGGDSRMIAWLKNDYEIWNLDKLEGRGFGPKNLSEPTGFRLVKDYIGAFSSELPDHYFDLVFSISTIEHIPEDQTTVDRCILDIERLLAQQGISIHCVDAFLHTDHIVVHPLVKQILKQNKSARTILDFETISNDTDLWRLPVYAYYTRWFPLTKRRLKLFGRPFSINVVWQKVFQNTFAFSE
jgi:ubiquinone/menaquinone biosynthesis C-methylase UbiE